MPRQMRYRPGRGSRSHSSKKKAQRYPERGRHRVKKPTEECFDTTSQITHELLDPAKAPDHLSKVLDWDDLKRQLDYSITWSNPDALAFLDVQTPHSKRGCASNSCSPTCWDFLVNTFLASQARLPAVVMPVYSTAAGLHIRLGLVSYECCEQMPFNLQEASRWSLSPTVHQQLEQDILMMTRVGSIILVPPSLGCSVCAYGVVLSPLGEKVERGWSGLMIKQAHHFAWPWSRQSGTTDELT
jgi:hypothetical protein